MKIILPIIGLILSLNISALNSIDDFRGCTTVTLPTQVNRTASSSNCMYAAVAADNATKTTDGSGNCNSHVLTHSVAGAPNPSSLVGVSFPVGDNMITWTLKDDMDNVVDTKVQTLPVLAPPSMDGATLTPTSTLCPNATDGKIVVSNPPTTVITNYSISPNEGSKSLNGGNIEFTGLTNKMYTITHTDGCPSTMKSATVGAGTGPSVGAASVSTPIGSCGGTGAIAIAGISPTGTGFTIKYTKMGGSETTLTNQTVPGGGTYIITGLIAGTYNSFKVSKMGCETTSGTSSVVLANPNPPTVGSITATTPISTCGGNNGIITIDGISPTGSGYTIKYTKMGSSETTLNNQTVTGGGTYAITGLSAGTYSSFKLTKDGCEATPAGSVVMADPNGPTVGAITASSQISTCGGSQGAITIAGISPSGSGFTIKYTKMGGSETTLTNQTVTSGNYIITGLSSGTYNTFKVIKDGCETSSGSSVSLNDPPLPTPGSPTPVSPTIFNGNDGKILIPGLMQSVTYRVDFKIGGTNQTAQIKTITPQGNFELTGLSPNTYNTIKVTVESTGCNVTLGGTVTVPNVDCSAFQPAAAQLSSACAGLPNGSIQVTNLSSGSANYTVAWDASGSSNDGSQNGITTPTFTIPGLPGTSGGKDYTITITDAIGCVVVKPNVKVFEVAALNPTIVGDFAFCSNQTQTSINVSQTFTSYLWSGGGTGQSKLVGVGTHSVTVTDSGGCTGTATSAAVVKLAPVTIDLGNGSKTSIDCAGQTTGKIIANVGGGSGSGRTFTWSGPNGAINDNDNTIDNLGAGTYNLTVVDNETCSATFSQAITIPSAINASTTATDASCNGFNNGAVTLTASGGTAPLTFKWSNASGSTTQNISNLTAGSYTVTVTDSKSCAVTSTSVVGQPGPVIASISPLSPKICLGKSIQLTASGGTSYVWANEGSTASITVSPTASSPYSVTVTDAGTNNCTAVANISVTVNPLPVAGITVSETSGTVPNDGTICQGSKITLTATGGLSYSWDGGEANPLVLTLNAAGTVTRNVTVTDGNSCTDTESRLITVNENPKAIINFSAANQTIQEPQNISNSSVANCGTLNACEWTFNNTNSTSCTGISPTYTTQGSKDITLRVTNSCGCSNQITQPIEIVPANSCVVETFSINNNFGVGCVGVPLDIVVSNRPSGGACAITSQKLEIKRNGTLVNISPSNGKITFPTAGTYVLTNSFSDNCSCSRSASRTIEIIPAPTVKFKSGNPTRACIGEELNIKFDDFDSGETVIVTGVGVGEKSYQTDNFNVSFDTPGTKIIKIIGVQTINCGASVNETIQITVVPKFKIESVVKNCDDLGVKFEYVINTSGGDPTANIIATGITGGTQVNGEQFIIKDLDPNQDYSFTLNKGTLCDPISIDLIASPCNCTFAPGSNLATAFAGCEGESFDISNIFNATGLGSEFNPENDTIIYVLHDKTSGVSLGKVSAIYPFTQKNLTNNFAGFTPGKNYFLSAVGFRKVLLKDFDFSNPTSLSNQGATECVSVVSGIPIKWFRTPTPVIKTLSGTNEICRNSYDYMVFVTNLQDGSNVRFEVVGQPDENNKTYGFNNSTFIHFKDTSKDSFIVRAIEEKDNFDPETNKTYKCIGISEIVLYVKNGQGAPDISEIVLWPGSILSSTADPANTCYNWGFEIGGVDSTNLGDNQHYFAELGTDFVQTGRKYYVDTYFCDNPDCKTRIYYNSDGPVPGLQYKELENFSFLVKPNPNHGQFNLDIYSRYRSDFDIEIINLTGKRILSKTIEVNSGNNIKDFNLELVPKGIYFMRIFDKTSKQYSVEKIIIN